MQNVYELPAMNLKSRARSVGLGFIVLCMLSLVALPGLAQEATVTGKVTDATSGDALPGVSIIIKGTSRGTTSDVQGNYSISTPEEATLSYSFVGYLSQEIAVNNRTTINIQLTEDIQTLQEVVVIGYGEINRADVTSSIASINQEELKNIPVPGIDQAIQGRLAGVQVSTDGGQPGGGVSVKIRGITSVNGTQPLYVIDGVPISADRSTLDQSYLGGGNGQTNQSVLATLNPEDIESIDVLKDASAQAIYGARAGNGVVMIKTKKGSGQGKITYDAYYGVSTIPKKLDVLNLRENAIYQNAVIGEINAVTGGSQQINPEFADPSLLGIGTDWQDEIYQKGTTQNHVLGFSGSSEKSNYYFSLGALDQEGTLIGTGFKRYTVRANIETDIKDWLKAGFTVNGSRSDQQIGLADAFDAVTSVVLYNSPAAPVRDVNGDYVGQIQIGNALVGNASNPVAMARFRDIQSVESRAFGSVYAEVKFLEGLTLRNEFNYNFNLSANKAFQPFVKNDALDVNIISPSRLREQRTNSIYYQFSNYLNYKKTFGDHDVFLTFGHEAQHSRYDYIQASRENLTLNLPSLAAGSDENQSIGAGAGDNAIESWFGRVNYTYKGRYAISGVMRADGSSSFGPNNRWAYYPAVSGSWTISNEPFAENVAFLDFLKIRLGYGSVGNQQTPYNNSFTANINLVPISPFGNGSLPANVPNPDLSWEKITTYNLGLDATLFNRLDIAIDVFKKETTDMLLSSQLPSYSGLGTNYDDIQTPITNDGKITNTGFEANLSASILNRGDFHWNSSFVFSHYKNKLEYLNSDEAAISGFFNEYGTINRVAYTQAGFPVGTFYGYVTDGLYTTMDELNSLETGLEVRPDAQWLGDIKFKDLDGDGDIDDNDVTQIGDPNPDFTIGFTNSFEYGGFDLSIFLYGSFGGDIYNYTRRQTEAMNSLYSNQNTTVLDRYTAENTDTNIPRYNQWHDNNRRISDRYIEDGTYLRIQNLSLGYQIPTAILSKAHISAFRVYVSAQNLVTFTDYSGYDPELGATSASAANANGILINVDNGRYPVPKTYTVGVNVTF